MSEVRAPSTRYRRAENLSWRDTGRHVLVAPVDQFADVLVMEGGSAVLWRLLHDPDSAEGLVQRLSEVEDAPDVETLVGILTDLTAQGVLRVDDPDVGA